MEHKILIEKIHNYTYSIMFAESELITILADAEEGTKMVGLTDYQHHAIYIAFDMTKEMQHSTLIHELSHAYIDAYNIDITDEESVCCFMAEYAREIVIHAQHIYRMLWASEYRENNK